MVASDEHKLELVEESLRVEAERVVTERVRVTTRSDLTAEVAHTSLAGERVEVTREAIGREVSEAPPMRIEGDVTIILVLEEIVVVEKRLMLVEEIRIRKIATTDEVSIPVTLRKQSATVERLGNNIPNEEKLP
ncbi:YsnF/AvaK domain-containing protein [Rhizobium sp. CG5]|uniref:YsnF/AvaK domain-containing protein n=1 Tax=Rhizobium sp. CG5 TaxID=2726076 RepID=UPI0020344E4C|nr:YsnF/AvaK domain-containing protein [Rhizobium sp. CG5]MCM2476440.1 YsnF/AvaK domain-containing protein [Rhizobium sp. CG5]